MRHTDNLALQTAEKIRSDLERYTAPDGSLLSGRKIAALLGVSHQTVCRAIQLLSEENLLTCRRGTRAKINKKSGLMRIACMICTEFDSCKFNGFSDASYQVQILLDELERMKCNYRIFNFYDLKQANFSPRIFSGFDGLIAARSFSDLHSRQLVNNFTGPKVWLWHNEPANDSGNQVIPDFMSGYSLLFDRARKKGIRHCVLHCSKPFFAEIMTEALRLNNWNDDEFTVVMTESPDSQLKAYKYALNMPIEKDTLYACSSDIYACGFLEAFKDRSLEAGSFHVSGTGDIESSCYLPFGEPLLTTLRTDRREMVNRALTCLFDKIKNNDSSTEIIKIKSDLVIRKSALM